MNKLPRHALPQIPKDKIPEFIKFLNEHDIQVKRIKVIAKTLQPIQAHVNHEKVERFKRNPKLLREPLLISQDGFILDGHHRWLAYVELDPMMEVSVICCMCKIKELIGLGHQFDGSFVKSVHEVTIYGQQIWEDEDSNEETEKALPLVRKRLASF